MTRVFVIGLGCGGDGTMTVDAARALAQADVVIGAPRLIDAVAERAMAPDATFASAITATDIVAAIDEAQSVSPCVVMSGDVGFYSGARKLIDALVARGDEPVVYPGISSVQYLAARLGRPWQDWHLRSAHGLEADAVAEVCQGAPVFFLTGPNMPPNELCAQLVRAGLGALDVVVGERLSYPEEKITRATAAEVAEASFDSLSALLVEPAPARAQFAPGIPDDEFIRGDVPMTKQEIRALIPAKLKLMPEDVCWDVGAGTGSCSIELALHAKSVWAIEKNPEGVELIEANRVKFGAWNLHAIEGSAPESLANLPKPDAVFIGGSSGNLPEIIACALKANPQVRLCITGIVLETVHSAIECLKDAGIDADVIQVSTNRARKVGGMHMMMAQNPIYIVSGGA